MKYTLEKSTGSNATVSKFNVVDEAGGIAGRICCSTENESDLLALWKGPAPRAAASAATASKRNPMIGAMLAAKKRPMSRAAILRGCS